MQAIKHNNVAKFFINGLSKESSEGGDPLYCNSVCGGTVTQDSPIRKTLESMAKADLSPMQLNKFKNTVNQVIANRFEEIRCTKRRKVALGDISPQDFVKAIIKNNQVINNGDPNITKHFEAKGKTIKTFAFNKQIKGLENLPDQSKGAATIIFADQDCTQAETIIIDAWHQENNDNKNIYHYGYTYGYDWGSSKQDDPRNNSLKITL